MNLKMKKTNVFYKNIGKQFSYLIFVSIQFFSRRKRLLELQEKASRARFGEVIEISAVDYVKEVNQAGTDIWVVLYLYKSG